MTVWVSASPTVLTAVDQARIMANTGAGLVVVLHRGELLAAVLHGRPGDDIALGQATASLGADAAVLIVVGPIRTVTPVLATADAVHKQLAAVGVDVVAVVQVRTIEHGAAVHHLSADTTARDFIAAPSPPVHGTSTRTGWFRRRKPA